jgi:hypothetical protein
VGGAQLVHLNQAGSLQLRLTAVDTAGNVAMPATVAFRIVC